MHHATSKQGRRLKFGMLTLLTNIRSRIWILRRLKPLGASQEELIDVYIKQIRCILEFAVAAWNSGLNKGQIGQIERVQKCALAVILDKEYISYNQALLTTNLKTLQERRKRNSAKKLHQKH